MGDWLGTGRIADQFKEFKPFNEAREFARSLGLKSGEDWKEYTKRNDFPSEVPKSPLNTYRGEYISMGDWLGTGRVKLGDVVYRPFEEAREFVHNLKLKNEDEWRAFTKTKDKPIDIPTNPMSVKQYKSSWKGMGDWLGTGNTREMDFLSFGEARKFVHSLKLNSSTEWKEYCKSGKKPNNIPSSPKYTYGEKYKGTQDWLGYKIQINQGRKKK
jgi:hypothetical protein